MKKVLIGLSILALIPIGYAALNIKPIFIAEGKRAPLWCGAVVEKGIYGVTTSSGFIEKPNPLKPLNGDFVLENEDVLLEEIMAGLEDNPFARLGSLLAEKFIESYAEGVDRALDDACQGDSRALLRFQDKVDSVMQELNSPY